MKQIVLLLFCAAASLHTIAQPQWQWAKTDLAAQYAINPTYARQVVATAQGKTFWGVVQNRKIIYGQSMMGDYSFQELDSSGNMLASFTATGKFALLKAEADAAGNWYVLGTYYDSVVLSPTLSLTRTAPGSGSDYFLFRLHAGTLNPDWLQPLGSNYYCQASCFTIANERLFLPMDSALATHIYQYDLSTGAAAKLWTQNGRSYTADIQADSIGNVYLIGNCVLNGPLDFNGTASSIPTSTNYPWYIARYHAEGRHDWHYYLSDITCISRGFRLHGNNELYLTGLLADSTTLAGFTFSAPPRLFNADYIMARLDSNGSLVWAQQRPVTSISQGFIDFSTAFHAAVADTVLYMLSETQGVAIWGSGGISTNTNNRHLATLTAFSKASGQALWAKTINGIFTTGQHLITDGISIWATGNGIDSSAITFDSVGIPATAGSYIPFLAKMQVAAQTDSVPPSTTVRPLNARQIRFWPNPASGFVFVDGLAGDEEVAIRDLSGRLLLQARSDGKHRLHIATRTLAKGIYLMDVAGPRSRGIMRFAVE